MWALFERIIVTGVRVQAEQFSGTLVIQRLPEQSKVSAI